MTRGCGGGVFCGSGPGKLSSGRLCGGVSGFLPSPSAREVSCAASHPALDVSKCRKKRDVKDCERKRKKTR